MCDSTGQPSNHGLKSLINLVVLPPFARRQTAIDVAILGAQAGCTQPANFIVEVTWSSDAALKGALRRPSVALDLCL